MLKQLDKIIEALKDRSSGWVTRRDAAEALGQIASRSLGALKAHANEDDVDVRSGVRRALADVGAVEAGKSDGTPTIYSLKELAQACLKKSKRTVKVEGEGYVVRVQTTEGRTQDVFIAPFERSDGRKLVRVSTRCGIADEETTAWAIRSNSQLMYCAFCVEERDEVEELVIVKNFNPQYVTPAMAKDAVKEIAYYGDWLEKKLSGEDKF